MTIYYLDTSAINRLFDSPSSKSLSQIIRERAVVYPSIFNIAELGSESDEMRRTGLIKLVKNISQKYRPLAMPADLLKRSIEGVKVWAMDMDHSISPEWDGVWVALNDPQSIDERAYQEILSWKKKQEEWFQNMHSRGRSAMQEAVNNLPQNDSSAFKSSFLGMLNFYPLDGQFVKNVVSDLVSRSGANVQIDSELVERILKHSEHWRFFLKSMAYGLYVRSVKSTHFSKKRNPGSIDTQQAVYLAACDVFVTADIQQRRMLRLLAPFGHKKRQILSYAEFELNLKKFHNLLTTALSRRPKLPLCPPLMRNVSKGRGNL